MWIRDENAIRIKIRKFHKKFFGCDRICQNTLLTYQLKGVFQNSNEYREYQNQVQKYEEAYPDDLQQFMLKHYYSGRPPMS
jgi:hypothetical protein